MKKSLIILGCVVLVVIVLFLVKSANTTKVNNKEYLNKYLKDNNYVEENGKYVKVVTDDGDKITDATTLDQYSTSVDNKSNIEYTTLSLDTNTFVFDTENRTYEDEFEKVYNASINLKESDVVKFDYLITVYTSQIMVEGSYNMKAEDPDNKFECKLYYQNELDQEESNLEKNYCLFAKVETLNFVGQINELKNDKRIFSMIKE